MNTFEALTKEELEQLRWRSETAQVPFARVKLGIASALALLLVGAGLLLFGGAAIYFVVRLMSPAEPYIIAVLVIGISTFWFLMSTLRGAQTDMDSIVETNLQNEKTMIGMVRYRDETERMSRVPQLQADNVAGDRRLNLDHLLEFKQRVAMFQGTGERNAHSRSKWVGYVWKDGSNCTKQEYQYIIDALAPEDRRKGKSGYLSPIALEGEDEKA